jgi:hypothetical protein
MTEADSILAGQRSRNRPDRIGNAFAPGYVIAESDETKNTMCIMTFTNAPGEGPPPHTHTVEDETFNVIKLSDVRYGQATCFYYGTPNPS